MNWRLPGNVKVTLFRAANRATENSPNGKGCFMNTIGVDLGGSHVLATVVDDNGIIIDRSEHQITDHTVAVAVGTIGAAIDDVVRRSAGIDAIGLGSPGSVDVATGTIVYSPNFGWRDVPLGPLLHERFGLPVHLANDARCATLGEYTYGAGRGTSNFVLLTLGTGIGGGIVADGKLLLGNDASAGEIGHHQIRATDGFCCNCGKVGCFEAQASGTGLIRHALALAPSFPRSSLVRGKPENLGSKSIRKAAELGDPHGLAAWKNYIADLARGLANIINFVNPAIIALGGGVAGAGNFMLDAVRPQVDELTTVSPRGRTQIIIATLGNDAGAIGAGTMARRGGIAAVEKAVAHA